MKKYLCIGGKYPTNSVPAKHDLNTYTSKSTIEIKPEWVPRWYKVPYEECAFAANADQVLHSSSGWHTDMLELTYRPHGDYEEYLKVLKTERLLNG